MFLSVTNNERLAKVFGVSELMTRIRSMRVSTALGVLLILIGITTLSAQTAQPAPCTNVGPSGEPTISDTSRVDTLQYECMRLTSGRNLLVGRAGSSDRPAVLLIHGLGDNAHRDWRQVIPGLATDYRVIAVDLPGFGGSDPLPEGYDFEGLATTLAELLDRDSVERAHVVGHSLGGAVSLYFAHSNPSRVNRLVLVDAAGVLLKSVYVHHVSKITTPEVGIGAVDQLLEVLDQRLNGFNRHVLRRLESSFDFSRWLADNPEIRAALLGGFTQTDAALGLIEHDFSRAIRETRAPTTVIWGRNDDVSPVRVGKILAGRMSNAQLHVIERTGHVPMNESPREFMPLLLEGLVASHAPVKPLDTTPPRPLECDGETGKVYSGSFSEVRLRNCTVRFENARIEKLVADGSTVELESVFIKGNDVGLVAANSRVTATVLDIDAKTGISAANSQLDLAGTRIQASERGVRVVTPSRIYFSVSDMAAPEFTGDLHRIWTDASAATEATAAQ